MQEAVLTGLQNNPTVTIQRLEPLVTNTYIREQRATFDPSISLSAERNLSKSQRRIAKDKKPMELQVRDYTAGFTITDYLPSGTTIDISTGLSGSEIPSLYEDQYTGTIGLTVTQSLLNGLSPRANLANLRQARLDVCLLYTSPSPRD